jgi:hypothetical protein
MPEITHNTTASKPRAAAFRRFAGIAIIALAIALSLASCTLLLLIPSASIDVETVYGGF